MLLFVLLACTGPVVVGEPDPCAAGFERGTDGACYEVEAVDDTAPDDTDTDTAPPDQDGDGFADAEDCAPTEAAISPAALEVCDELDNDCDGQADEGLLLVWNQDYDGDGFGGRADVESCTQPAGYVANDDDCDDRDATAYPDAPDDTGDGVDNDCDGRTDEDYDACAASFGEADWWSPTYDTAGFGAGVFPMSIEGSAVVCDVTCDVGWAYFEGIKPDGFTSCDGAYEALPYLIPDGEARACIAISDPGSATATGTCTAHTSAGDIAIDITWTE